MVIITIKTNSLDIFAQGVCFNFQQYLIFRWLRQKGFCDPTQQRTIVGKDGVSFFGQSGVVFGAALKVCLLAFQLALAICKKSGAFFCIDEDQRNTLIVIKKREMLIDAPIVGYRQISQAVFIVKSAVGTGRASTDIIQE